MTELARMGAVPLASAIAARQVSCVEVMQAVLAQTDAFEPVINAFASLDADGALMQARHADAALARGAPAGPLHGVPVSVKDLIDVAGFETGYGSWLMQGNMAARDAVAVARLRQAGAIIFGKSTTPEFAGSVLTESERHGITRNPWDPRHTPGGSSGGAGAALAAGCGPLALATDGAGSARIPASCCGVVGLKPTLGRVPHPQAPDLFSNFTHLGVMARTVPDVALMLEVMQGPDAGDPWSVGRAWASLPAYGLNAAQDRAEDAPVHRAWYFSRMGNPRVSAEVDRLCRAAVEALEGRALQTQEYTAQVDWGIDLSRIIMRSVMSARMTQFDAEQRKQMGPGMRRAVCEGEAMAAHAIKAAPLARSELFRRVESLLSEHQLILSPTLSAPPPAADFDPVGEFHIDGHGVGDLRAGWFTYPTPFNLTGHPAISVPVGFTPDGLPVGLHAVAGWGQERTLLDLASRLHQYFEWNAHWPELAQKMGTR